MTILLFLYTMSNYPSMEMLFMKNVLILSIILFLYSNISMKRFQKVMKMLLLDMKAPFPIKNL